MTFIIKINVQGILRVVPDRSGLFFLFRVAGG